MVLHLSCRQRLARPQNRADRDHIRASVRRFLQTLPTLLVMRSLWRIMAAIPLASLLSLVAPSQNYWTRAADDPQIAPGNLKQLSLEQLGNLQVTTVSKEPQAIQRTAAAIYVLTQEDIRRSGATSIPEVLRLVPGVEVAQIDSSTWAVGIRGFGSIFSKSVHHHQEFQRQPGNVGFRWRRQC